ncbi:hypothetical protein BHE74_00029749, partial [Ensete ventricosum]
SRRHRPATCVGLACLLLPVDTKTTTTKPQLKETPLPASNGHPQNPPSSPRPLPSQISIQGGYRPPPTPSSHFLIRPFDVDALTNVHPAASDPQISTAHVASLDAPKVRTSFMVAGKCLSSSLNCLCRIEDMAKQRQLLSTHDASPRSFKSREWDSMSRWSEYINIEEFSSSIPMNGRSLGSDAPPNSGTVPKALHMEWVVQLS